MLPPCALHRVDPQCFTAFLRSTGWTHDVLPPFTLHKVDPQCLTSLCSTQGGPRMSYFLLLFSRGVHNALLPFLSTVWTHNVLLPCALHRVEPTMSYFLILYIKYTHNVLLPFPQYRVEPTMSNFNVLHTGWNPQYFTTLYSTEGGPKLSFLNCCWSVKHHASTLVSRMLHLYFVQFTLSH